jgi:hypothetical protein
LLFLLAVIGLLAGFPFLAIMFGAIVGASLLVLVLTVLIFGRGLPDVLKLWTYIYVRLIGWASLIAAVFRPDVTWTKTEHGRATTLKPPGSEPDFDESSS